MPRWLRHDDVVLPCRPVVITFDDGFANFLDVVPDLLERGCPVTMFVPTAYVGGESEWLAPEFRRPMLTWSQLVDLDNSGVEIGAHAHVHRPIDTLRIADVVADVTRSRNLLEEHLGHECASFAYPHGYSSRRVRAVVAEAGFAQACAVKDSMSGPGDDPMAIARLFVGWDDVGERFERLLAEGHRRRRHHERLVTRGWRVARARARTHAARLSVGDAGQSCRRAIRPRTAAMPRLPIRRAAAGANLAAIAKNGSGSSRAENASSTARTGGAGMVGGGEWRYARRATGSRWSSTKTRPSTWSLRGTSRPVRSRCIARTTSTPAPVSNNRNCAPARGLKSSNL